MSFPSWKLISTLSMDSLSVCYGYYLVLLSRGGGVLSARGFPGQSIMQTALPTFLHLWVCLPHETLCFLHGSGCVCL